MINLRFATLSTETVLGQLKTSTKGLSEDLVDKHRSKFGWNELPEPRKKSKLLLFISQFKSLLVLVLFIAAVLSWATGNVVDVYVIMTVVFIDASIGFFQNQRAERAIASLKKMITPVAKVVRNGTRLLVPARELVPGDIIEIEEGDSVPADARLIEVRNVRTSEASLTGESVPASKISEPIAVVASLADAKNMIWKGTFSVAGFGRAVVVATGAITEIGKIATSLTEIEIEKSHFRKKIDRLATQMGIASVISALVLFGVGYLGHNMELNELLLTSVAAMVSIIPEGLPSIIAVVLAIGANRMTKRNAIIREYTATETLGAVSTIITDKTGTLTENALTVRKIFLPDEQEIEITGEGWFPAGNFIMDNQVMESLDSPALEQLLRISELSNNSSIQHNKDSNTYQLLGDPTEGALLVLSKNCLPTYLVCSNKLNAFTGLYSTPAAAITFGEKAISVLV